MIWASQVLGLSVSRSFVFFHCSPLQQRGRGAGGIMPGQGHFLGLFWPSMTVLNQILKKNQHNRTKQNQKSKLFLFFYIQISNFYQFILLNLSSIWVKQMLECEGLRLSGKSVYRTNLIQQQSCYLAHLTFTFG